MQQELKVALIQSNLVWENPIQNRINFEAKIKALPNEVDIVILPEMFTTGFTMNASANAESMNGDTVQWMKRMANATNAAIVGSVIISENEQYFNRLIFAKPNQTIHYYDKKHTFTLAGEDKVYKSGEEKVILDYKGWKICPLICYDLRFPVWARNIEDYDVLIYVANWPKVRVNAWSALLKARAIENMSYCLGVNRVGLDANSFEYSGHSAAYDVLGNRLDAIPENKEFSTVVTLSKSHISKYRTKLQFLNDKDEFNLV